VAGRVTRGMAVAFVVMVRAAFPVRMMVAVSMTRMHYCKRPKKCLVSSLFCKRHTV